MKYYTYKMNMLFLNVFSVVLLVFMVLFTYFLTGNLSFIEDIKLISIVCIILWVFLHEILHSIGFMSLGKVKWKNVVYGAELEKGIFYCMCKQEISKANIIVSLLFPLVLIGIVTYIIGLSINNDLLILLSIFNISGAVGDIAMLIDIIRMPNDIKYLDLDDTTSFTILSKKNLSKNKYISILDKTGTYNERVKAKDYTKLKVSKYSKYFLIIFIIITIVALLMLLAS